MVQFAENAHLVERAALLPIFVLVLHAFYGHDLPGLLVEGLADGAETAVAQLVAHLVLLHLNIATLS